MITNLVTHGQIVTTSKRAKVLKAEADKLLSKLVRYAHKYDEKDAKREAGRVVKSIIFTDVAGKKLVNDLLPKYLDEERKTGFVITMKLGLRPGDSAEKVLVKLA